MIKRGARFWEALYKDQDVESMPWYLSGMDRDLEKAVKKRRWKHGKALDLGTGPGTQAMALAASGFEVVGTDISRSAIRKAKLKIRGKKIAVDFRYDDILKTKLKGPFDLIFDRGCFHTLPPRQRACYVRHVHRLLKEGGFLFLKCFSHKEPFDEGPYRFKPQEIKKLFGGVFEKVSLRRSVFEGVRRPHPLALFCEMRKAGGALCACWKFSPK